MVGARGWNADCGEPYREQYEAPPGETGEKPKPAVENPGTDRPGGEPDRRDQRPRVRGEDDDNYEQRKRNRVNRSREGEDVREESGTLHPFSCQATRAVGRLEDS